MRVTVLTPPGPLVDWATAKAHLRLETNDRQAEVEAIIAAAGQWLAGPVGWLGRSIGEQTLELRTERLGCGITLPHGVVLSVTSVKYLDASRVEQTLDPSLYELRGDYLVPTFGAPGLLLACDDEAVRVVYVAGYETVPAPITYAVLLLVGTWFSHTTNAGLLRSYEVQGAFTEQYSSPDVVSKAADAAVNRLLAPYRMWST